MVPCHEGSMTRRRDWNEDDIDPEERKVLHGLPRMPVRKKRWAMFSEEKAFVVEDGHITGLRIKRADTGLDGIGTLKYLKALEMGACQLNEVPTWVQGLHALEFLSLAGNPIATVPEWLDAMPRVQVLDLRDTLVAKHSLVGRRWRVLDKIWDLFPIRLQSKDCQVYAEDEYAFAVHCYPYTIGSHKIAKHFPEPRARPTSFYSLFYGPRRRPMPVDKLIAVLLKRKYSDNATNITNAFNAQGKMTELVIKDTPIGDLPAWLAPLNKLTSIRLVRCNLTTFPKVLLSLPQLAVIDLSQNEITKIPAGASKLPHLKILSTAGNPITSSPELSPKTLVDNAGAIFGDSRSNPGALKVQSYLDYKMLSEEIEHRPIYEHTLNSVPESSREYFKTLDLHYLFLRNEVQEKHFKECVKELSQFQANKKQNMPLLTQFDLCEEYGVEQLVYLCPATWIPPFLKYVQEERDRYLTFWSSRPNIYKLRDVIHACFYINAMATSAASYHYGRTGQRPLYYGWKHELLTQACDLARKIKAPFFQWGYQMSSLGDWKSHPIILYFQFGDKQCSFHCDLTCPMPRFKGKWIGVRNEEFPVSEPYLRNLIMRHHYDPAQEATYEDDELDHNVWANIEEGEHVLRRDTMRHLREEGILDDGALEDYDEDLDSDEDDEMEDYEEEDERYYSNW